MCDEERGVGVSVRCRRSESACASPRRDDYVTKPFEMEELLARMRAELRHQLQVQGERPVFRAGDLSVDLVRRIVKLGNREVKLSPKEYDLLRTLVQHAGKVLNHRFLLHELWDDLTDAQYLRVYVRQLRQKIEPDPQYVLTETASASDCDRRTESPQSRASKAALAGAPFRTRRCVYFWWAGIR